MTVTSSRRPAGLIRFDGHLGSGVGAPEVVHHGEESRGKEKPPSSRSFTPEFKAEVVELCRRGGSSIGQVAKGFDLRNLPGAAAPCGDGDLRDVDEGWVLQQGGELG